MSATYYAHTCTRYYSDPTAPDGLRAVVEDGHCNIWHNLMSRGESDALCHHVEICEICQAWIERCRKIALASLEVAQKGAKQTTRPARKGVDRMQPGQAWANGGI